MPSAVDADSFRRRASSTSPRFRGMRGRISFVSVRAYHDPIWYPGLGAPLRRPSIAVHDDRKPHFCIPPAGSGRPMLPGEASIPGSRAASACGRRVAEPAERVTPPPSSPGSPRPPISPSPSCVACTPGLHGHLGCMGPMYYA